MKTVPLRHKPLVSKYIQTHELPRQFTKIKMDSEEAAVWKRASIDTLDQFFAGDNSERDEDPAIGSILYDWPGTNAKIKIKLAESEGVREAFHTYVPKESGETFSEDDFTYYHQKGDEVHTITYDEKGEVKIGHAWFFDAEGQGFFSTSPYLAD